MISIAITGGIGSGKSIVCSYLENKGYRVIYADKIAKEMTSSNGSAINEIEKAFGPEYILPDGSMDRDKMRNLVFSYPEELEKLEEITTKVVRDDIKRIIEESNEDDIVFIEVPLLFEKGAQEEYNYSWLIVSDENIKLQRVINRDGISSEQTKKIINSQMNDNIKMQLADEIIENNGSLEELHSKIDALMIKYLSLI